MSSHGTKEGERRRATDASKRGATPTNEVQRGELEFKGFELELTANWVQFDLIANYGSSDLDESVAAVPEDQYSLWSIYRLVNGLRLGAGVRHVGESETGIAGFQNPDYTLYDAFIGYDYNEWSFQLNANNLTDEVHTTSCLARGDCFVGERRYVTAEARYSF